MSRICRICVTALLAACVSWTPALAQQALIVKPLAERRVTELPSGDLFWRIESVDTKAQADAAAGPWSLVAESAGKTWLFTLGPAGGATPGATKIAEDLGIGACIAGKVEDGPKQLLIEPLNIRFGDDDLQLR